MELQAAIIDSIGKLSIEVVAIITLAYLVWVQAKNHTKMTDSIDRLTHALTKKFDRDTDSNKALKKSMETIHKTLKDHGRWSKRAVAGLASKS